MQAALPVLSLSVQHVAELRLGALGQEALHARQVTHRRQPHERRERPRPAVVTRVAGPATFARHTGGDRGVRWDVGVDGRDEGTDDGADGLDGERGHG